MSNKNAADLILNDPQPVTFADYVDGVRIAAPYMKSAALTLSNAAPHDLDSVGKKQLALILEIAKHGDDVLDERQSVASVKPWFVDFGNAWGGLYDSLLGKSRLPASLSDRGERASRVLARLFPDGVMFARRDAHAAWSEGDRRLLQVVELDLKHELDELVGKEFFDAAKKATAALGEALGVGSTKRETPKSTDLQGTVLRFSREVARYARHLAAEVDTSEPASVERFREAVAVPIDAFRSRRAAADGVADPAAADPAAPVVATSAGATTAPGATA